MTIIARTAEPLADAARALAVGRWGEARAAYEAALEHEESPRAWDGLGWAAFWLSDEAVTLRARENAYRGYRLAGDARAAGLVAAWLAADYREFRGELSIARGWLERAHRLLDPLPEGAEHGWLALNEVSHVLQETGDAEVMGEVFAGFATAMSTGLMLVLVVLILLFGSVFHSFTILGSLPLAIGGVAAALFLTNSAVSMPVVIGILMLMGIVTKNAIMLVEFAIESIRSGMTRDAAIIDAGMKRARPIVMTTIAMAAGMVPSALAFGAGGEFRSPMALAVIGGLIFSTLLSLIFVPAMFLLMDDVGRLFARLGRKLLVSSGEHDDEPPSIEHKAT